MYYCMYVCVCMCVNVHVCMGSTARVLKSEDNLQKSFHSFHQVSPGGQSWRSMSPAPSSRFSRVSLVWASAVWFATLLSCYACCLFITCVSFRVFLVLVLKFRFLIHLELIFIMVWDKGPVLVFLMKRISSFSQHFWLKDAFPSEWSWQQNRKSLPVHGKPVSPPGFQPTSPYVCHPARPHASGAHSFLESSEVASIGPPSLSFLEIILFLWILLRFHMSLSMGFSFL